ncbi:glycosyl hydrolase family 28-related protein [Chitinophaga sp. MM2321]|uniref:glycosyl hydrolase family 28-related protein n=1 Tax=Chitinophaga sp. MM2321 TaxID=3137178 RepID=UPI0032D58AB5
MKRYFEVISICIITMQFTSSLAATTVDFKDSNQLNVRNYGAIGDGVSDDSKAIQKCFDEAKKFSKAKIVFPGGTYLISTPIQYNNQNPFSIEISGGKGESKLLSKKFLSFFIVRGNTTPSGNVTIHDLSITGFNPPYSSNHPFYDQPGMYAYGVALFNLASANIYNLTIRDIYGEGIYMVNDQRSKAPLSASARNVKITNNQILNCWGLLPSLKKGYQDEYGDGIYLSNVQGAQVRNNVVKNDLSVTKQFGRAGIVLEFNDEECLIDKNEIFGYDRDIHIEGDLGGHIISNNKLTGSEIGILTSLSCKDRATPNPIVISNNYISNEGIPLHNSLTRVFPMASRALVSLNGDWKKARVGSTLSGNTIVFDPQSDYTSKVLVSTWISFLNLKDNVFSQANIPDKKLSVVFGYEVGDLINNSFKNVADVRFPGVKVKGDRIVTGKNSGNTKTAGTISNLKF